MIFSRYRQVDSAQKLAQELNEKGFRTKTWKTRKGEIHKSEEFNPDTIYRMLKNPLYIGKVRHKDKIYKGEHEAIIEQTLWDEVQAVTAENRRAYGFVKRKMEAPFKGLLKCGKRTP